MHTERIANIRLHELLPIASPAFFAQGISSKRKHKSGLRRTQRAAKRISISDFLRDIQRKNGGKHTVNASTRREPRDCKNIEEESLGPLSPSLAVFGFRCREQKKYKKIGTRFFVGGVWMTKKLIYEQRKAVLPAWVRKKEK